MVARVAPLDLREVSKRTSDEAGAHALRRYPYRPFLSGSSVTMDPQGRQVFAVDSDTGTLAVADAASLEVVRTVRVCDGPEQVAVSRTGRAYVTCRGDGEVVSLEPDGTEKGLRRRVGSEPFGVALSADGRTVYVTTASDGRLHALRADDLGSRWSLAVGAHPRGLAVSPDGRRVVVAHLVGRAVTVVDVVARRVRSAALPSRRDGWVSELFDDWSLAEAPLRVPGGAYAVAMSPGGTRAFVPYLLRNEGSTIETFTPGCYANGASVPVAPSVAAVDLGTARVQRPMPRPLSGAESGESFGDLGMVQTMAGLGVVRAAFHDPVHSRLLVVGEGSGQLLAFDTSRADPTVAPIRDWFVGGPARGVVVDPEGRRAFVHLPFDHAVRRIDLDENDEVDRRFVVGHDVLDPAAALGRRLLHAANDSRLSGIAGVSCTTCHLESRSDGVTWRLEGQSLQTPVLAGRVHGEGPLRWRGDSRDLAHAIGEAVRRIQGQGLPDEDVRALSAYLGQAPLPRSPHPMTSRGAIVFEEAGCSSCHAPESDFTDGQLHDVRGGRYRTPSLRGAFLSAPYYHDGSAPTLRALLSAHDRRGNPMAVGTRLSRSDQSALEGFLRSL